MGHSIKRTVWLVGRLLLVALAADLLRPVATFAIPPVVESFLSLSDVTTANSSTSKHGFLKKLDNTATHYMDGTGAWSTPAGGFVLLEEHTASSSATLDFTTAFTSAYDDYEIRLVNLTPATNSVTLQMLVSTNGGSTWLNTNYLSQAWGQDSGNSTGGAGASSTSQFTIGDATAISNTSTGSFIGVIQATNFLVTSSHFSFQGDLYCNLYTDGKQRRQWFGGTLNSASAVNAIRFQSSSGNIASGTIRVYGLAK